MVDDKALHETTCQTLNLTTCVIARLNIQNDAQNAQVISVPIGGEWRSVMVAPYSIRSEHFRVLEQREDGLLHEVKVPENTVRGNLIDDADSVMAGGFMANGLYARIILGDGTDLWMEPIGGRVAGAGNDLYAIYVQPNVIGGVHTCGNPAGDPDPDDVGHVDRMDDRGATRYHAILNTDADWEFFQFWGGTSAVSGRISTIINTMNLQYERDVNITHDLATTIIRTTSADPYSTTDPATFNTQIEAEWNDDQAGTSDVVHVFTGKEMDGSTIGRANHIGSICLDGDSNCWAESDYNNNFMSAVDLSAHELGHLWDAVHCDCGNPDASTMNPSITGINRFTFSNDQNNVAQIIAYRNGRGCLTTTVPGTSDSNNDCAGAILVGEGRFGFRNTGATTDGPAVTGCGSGASIQEDIWFTYRAPCDGTLTIETCDSAFDTVVVVYTGSCASPVQIACNDDVPAGGLGCPGTLQSRLTVAVDFNVLYRIRVGGYLGAEGQGIIRFDQTSCPAPSNNTCANAITVTHCEPRAFSTIGATTDGPFELADCNFSSNPGINQDIWFRYVAPFTGTIRVSTCGASFDSEVAVYNSCPTGSNQSLVCNDDNGPACAGLDASAQFEGVAGADYIIRIGGYSNAEGTGTLTITNVDFPIPSNDDCAANSPLLATGSHIIDTRGACDTDILSANCINDGGDIPRDRWYRWISPSCPVNVTMETCSAATFDTKLAVYDTCPLVNGPAIDCSDDDCPSLRSRITFTATPSNTYFIRIGGYNGQTGTATLSISNGPCICPCNWNGDNFLDSSDFFAFLQDFFVNDADYNGSGATDSSDFFDFLACFFNPPAAC